MITLLASLLGFISSMFPSLLKLLQDKSDKKHELSVFELQIEADKKKQKSKLEAINSYHNIEATKALYKTYHTGISWVDALNGTVRPVIAYGFFLLYEVLKFLQDFVWLEEDQAIFASVISFYFGQRTVTRINGNGNGK